MLPDGWKHVQLGEISKVTGGKRLPKGGLLVSYDTGYPYIRVTDMLDGSVCLSNIKYVPDNLAKKIEKYRIFKDDLFITVAGTIGVIGSIPDELDGANLTENADRISEIKTNKTFLMEFLRSPLIQSYIENVKTNNAQPKLALEQIRTFPILLPPLPEQKKIAAILSTWDRAIEGTEKLLANSQQQKKALMQQLLTGKKRLPGFTGEWKRQSFKVIFDVDNQKDTQTPASEYKEEGRIPIVDQGKSFISGYTDTNTVYENVPVIIFGDHTRVIKWVDFPFSPGADGTQVLRTQANTLNKFGYYLLQNVDLPNLGYSRHMKELKEQIFHLPPLSEQKSIAAVLSTADEELAALESDLTRLRQEKKALMQQLLTGKRRVKVD